MKNITVCSIAIIVIGVSLFFYNKTVDVKDCASLSSKLVAPQKNTINSTKANGNGEMLAHEVQNVDNSKPDTLNSVNAKMKNDSYLIAFAREAIGESLVIPIGCKTKIIRNNNIIEIIFLYPTENGSRGPDYYAKVEINQDTGLVVRILAGS